MVEKFKDAANILKAKFMKDELEQKLVEATSQQNWQTPTNLLHEIANAAYNYEKCQQITQFIWDKLKRKNTWRKIMKALNLVEFLIKNGPSSIVNSYKYDVYQFKSFSDYTHTSSDGTDRSQAIRERAKSIVQLLTNQQILEQQRTKAKTIRQRMSGMTNNSSSSGYSGYSGDSKYSGYDSKNYGNSNRNTNTSNSNKNSNYGTGSLNTAYGDYTYNKSTLTKYKQKQSKDIPKITKPQSVIPTSSTNQFTKPDITNTQQPQNKKPFEKAVPKLGKPGEKSSKVIVDVDITNSQGNVGQSKKNQQNGQNGSKNFIDDDIFGVTTTQPQPQVNTNANLNINVQQTQPTLINPMYSTTAPLANQNIAQQQFNFINPMYPTTAPMVAQQQQQNTGLNNFNFVNPMYSTTAPMVAQQQQSAQFNQMYNMYGTPTTATNPYQQQQSTQNWGYNPQPQQQFNPYTNQPTNQGIYSNTNTNINTNANSNTTYNPYNNIQMSTNQTNQINQTKVESSSSNWLTANEKGLIDFSDFGTEIKKNQPNKNNNNSKNNGNVGIDAWW